MSTLRLSGLHRSILVGSTLIAILGLYLYLGGYTQLYAYHQQQPLRDAVVAIKKNPAALAKLTQQLHERVKAHADDAKGWYLLARLYLHQQRYAEAALAFARAYEIDPREKALLSWQLESIYLANHEKLTADVRLLMDKVQRVDPQSIVLQHLQKPAI